jgi:hypothetical protein
LAPEQSTEPCMVCSPYWDRSNALSHVHYVGQLRFARLSGSTHCSTPGGNG